MELALHIATDILQGIGAIIITGSSGAAVIDLTYAACKRQFNNRLEPVRLQLAQRLVLALEFLIGADILSSLHTPTLKDVRVAGRYYRYADCTESQHFLRAASSLFAS